MNGSTGSTAASAAAGSVPPRFASLSWRGGSAGCSARPPAAPASAGCSKGWRRTGTSSCACSTIQRCRSTPTGSRTTFGTMPPCARSRSEPGAMPGGRHAMPAHLSEEDLQAARRAVPGLSEEPPRRCRRSQRAVTRRPRQEACRSLTRPGPAAPERIWKSSCVESPQAPRADAGPNLPGGTEHNAGPGGNSRKVAPITYYGRIRLLQSVRHRFRASPFFSGPGTTAGAD